MAPSTKSGLASYILRALIAALGLVALYSGVDNAFGGIASLGFQSPPNFYAVTDATAFALRDSNIRFLGGLWLALGALFLAGAIWLQRLRITLSCAFGLLFIGGLARLTASDLTPVLGGPLTASLAAELILMPALALWTLRSR